MNLSTQNRREAKRIPNNCPIQLSLGMQMTILAHVRDISLKSVFVPMKNSFYIQKNAVIDFSIKEISQNEEDVIKGSGVISRIAENEGIAILFIQMKEDSLNHLKNLVEK